MNLKNFTIILAVLAVVSFYACTQKPQSNNSSSPATASLTDDPDTLSVDTAKRYVANYDKNNNDSIPELDKKKEANTKCVWFSIARMKRLVAKIEKEHGDGIRFYLASYDKKYDKKSVNAPEKDYWGHNTLIMVSTYLDTVNHNHNDYYNKSPLSNTVGTGSIINAVPENRGELCPPPVNCKSIGATLFNDGL